MVDLSSSNGILNGYNFDDKIFIVPAAIVISVVGLAAYKLYMMVQGKQTRMLKKKNNDKKKK
uniref:Uncharacterized protein n=1 Tax=Romanomermis culicivorax TaxID=13658 RepID=A0A915L4U5_ROMCU